MVLRLATLSCLLAAACSSNDKAATPGTGGSDPSTGGTSLGAGGNANTGPYHDTRVRVDFFPIDNTTSAGDTVPGVVFDTQEPASEAVIADVRSKLSLRTWPEQTEVQGEAMVHDPLPEARIAPGVAWNPSAPLEDRWYVIRLASVPEGVRMAPPGSYLALPDGAFGARFRTGSDPVLWGIQVCMSDPQTDKVRILFSERVTTTIDVATIVTVTQNGAAPCQVGSSPATPNGDTLIALGCSLIDRSAALTVSLAAGLTSTAGKPVAPFSHHFTPRDLPSIESGCQDFRP